MATKDLNTLLGGFLKSLDAKLQKELLRICLEWAVDTLLTFEVPVKWHMDILLEIERILLADALRLKQHDFADRVYDIGDDYASADMSVSKKCELLAMLVQSLVLLQWYLRVDPHDVEDRDRAASFLLYSLRPRLLRAAKSDIKKKPLDLNADQLEVMAEDAVDKAILSMEGVLRKHPSERTEGQAEILECLSKLIAYCVVVTQRKASKTSTPEATVEFDPGGDGDWSEEITHDDDSLKSLESLWDLTCSSLVNFHENPTVRAVAWLILSGMHHQKTLKKEIRSLSLMLLQPKVVGLITDDPNLSLQQDIKQPLSQVMLERGVLAILKAMFFHNVSVGADWEVVMGATDLDEVMDALQDFFAVKGTKRGPQYVHERVGWFILKHFGDDMADRIRRRQLVLVEWPVANLKSSPAAIEGSVSLHHGVNRSLPRSSLAWWMFGTLKRFNQSVTP